MVIGVERMRFGLDESLGGTRFVAGIVVHAPEIKVSQRLFVGGAVSFVIIHRHANQRIVVHVDVVLVQRLGIQQRITGFAQRARNMSFVQCPQQIQRTVGTLRHACLRPVEHLGHIGLFAAPTEQAGKHTYYR